MATLRMAPGFAEVLKVVTGSFHERGEQLLALSSAIRVGPTQYPEIDALRHECARILDLDPVPDVFVARGAEPQAMTIGMQTPFVVLTTGLVELLDLDGLRFAVGHEFGHVLSGHAVYRTMLLRLLQLRLSMSWTPMSALGLRAIIAALNEWFRKAELSCDRAGLLCCQDPAAALRTQVLLAGGIDPSRIDTEAFLRQASEYDSVDSIRDSIVKLRQHRDAVASARRRSRRSGAAMGGLRGVPRDPGRRLPPEGRRAARDWAADVKAAARASDKK